VFETISSAEAPLGLCRLSSGSRPPGPASTSAANASPGAVSTARPVGRKEQRRVYATTPAFPAIPLREAHQAPLPAKQGFELAPDRDDHVGKLFGQTGEAVTAHKGSPLRLLGRVVGERVAQRVRPYGQRGLPASKGRLDRTA
jgi:hypothetical protein